MASFGSLMRSLGPRDALQLALWLPKRLRQFLDAEARRRDSDLKETLVAGSREVRAELSSLGTEQDVAGRRLEAMALTVAGLEAELARLRSAIALLPATTAAGDSGTLGLATAYALGAMAALPRGAAVLDASEAPPRVAWSLAALGYSVTALGAKRQQRRAAASPSPDIEWVAARLPEYRPEARRFDGIVRLQDPSERSELGPAADLERLRALATPGAKLVLSLPAKEREALDGLPGWEIDDYTVAQPETGRARKRRRMALVTGRAV